MRASRVLALPAVLGFCILALSTPPRAQTGGPDDPSPPNVTWSLGDSVSACPAGDSVFSGHSTHKHPSRLRITVRYTDANEEAKVGVPPESIWVTYTTTSGNVRVYADDSTGVTGRTRITIPSLSGVGTLQLTLMVTGVSQGNKNVQVRSTDVDADIEGRTTASDSTTGCDIDWGGSVTQADRDTIGRHLDHWKRNALHGTLVRRTNLSYARGAGSIGASLVYWNPSGRWLSYTIHGPSGEDCHVFTVPSDPTIGNQPKQFTWLPDTSDYDPSWSPLNTEIAFGRADYRIMRKGIPGLNADTTERLVAQSGSFESNGDLTPAISPDGQSVAFARRDPATGFHIWTVPIAGGAATQITATPGATDQYPCWSPDGNWIAFDREIGYPNEHHAYKVRVNPPGDTTTYRVYSAGAGRDAATPAYSPDSLVVTMGVGTHSETLLDVVTNVLDPALSTPKPIVNYSDTTFAVHGLHPVLSPKISPDGTRLAVRSRQLWAARRNMSAPPRLTALQVSPCVSPTVVDSTALVSIEVVRGQSNTIVVSATDAESDALAYNAFFLSGTMSFDPPTATFFWTPPTSLPIGLTTYVKFFVTTASGGTDAIVAALVVRSGCSSLVRVAPSSGGVELTSIVQEVGPNPSRGEFTVLTPDLARTSASLRVYDLSGRAVAVFRAPAGERLTWDGRDARGATMPSGIYLYRIEVGQQRKDGRFVVVR